MEEYVYSTGLINPIGGIRAFKRAAFSREIIAAARGAEADVPNNDDILPPITT